jgi:hypothetical protein
MMEANLCDTRKKVVGICNTKEDRVCQGDIIKDVKYIEKIGEITDDLDLVISMINFPFVVVLSQDCDLSEDYDFRYNKTKEHEDQDKILFSLLVAPLYTAAQVLNGEHLNQLKLPNGKPMIMQDLRKSKTKSEQQSRYKFMMQNEIPRYHYLGFPESLPISDSFIDFKHYFSANIKYLEDLKKTNFVCKIGELYRESVSQRFSNYLSRIGLP